MIPVPHVAVLFAGALLFVLGLVIFRLLSLLELKKRQIAFLIDFIKRDQGSAVDKLALSYSVSSNDVAGVRAQSIPPTGANSSGPHEATGSQKSANGK